ncbi:hypothetical protein [Brevundimonas vesicularis]|uniref:hypothetical protein n=1 Tax=Brevundimonas vesicularis TaxID=41276 RepID=UPI0038D46E3F
METPPKDNVTPATDPDGAAPSGKAMTSAQQEKADRAQRLAAALRQNLRRRKLPKTAVRPVDERN